MAPTASLVNFKHEHGPQGTRTVPPPARLTEKLPHRHRTNPTVLAHARDRKAAFGGRSHSPAAFSAPRFRVGDAGVEGSCPHTTPRPHAPFPLGPRPPPGRLPAEPERFWAAYYSMGETTGAAPFPPPPPHSADPPATRARPCSPAAPNGASTTEPACPPTSQLLPYTSHAGRHDASDGGTLPGARSAGSPDRMDAQAISHISQDLQGLPVRLGLLGRHSAPLRVCHSCELFGV